MNKTVLVVEDAPDVHALIEKILKRKGYQVLSAFNGQLAVDLLENLRQAGTSKPNLILLDLMMPVMDGFAFREWQRNQSSFADIPVVVMTADANVDAYHGQLQARTILRKPFDITALLKTVEEFGFNGH